MKADRKVWDDHFSLGWGNSLSTSMILARAGLADLPLLAAFPFSLLRISQEFVACLAFLEQIQLPHLMISQ